MSGADRPRRRFPLTGIELGIAAGTIFLLAVAFGDEYQAQIPRRLLFGWYEFLLANLHAVQPGGPRVVEALVCTALLGVGGHYFCRWLWARSKPHAIGEWRVRWTVTGLAGLLLLFTAGIATIGITHQAAWLFTMNGPMIVDSWGPRFILPEVLNSAVRARAAVDAYYSRTGRLPSSAREAGVDEAELVASQHVKAMRIEEAGAVVIELQHPAAEGRVVVLTPKPRGDELDWKCASNLERIHLPPACRN